MSTSGSVNFTVNRNEIINLSASDAGVKGIGRVLSAAEISDFNMYLNLIVKSWMGNSDFAPGLKIWSRKRGTIFPALDDRTYTLGPNGDHATSSYSQTTVSANEAIGQTVISVASTTGMTAGDFIGIRCSDGSIHWTTIVSTGAGPTVTITSSLTVAAVAGAVVYWYTSKLLMPLHVISLRRKTTAASEDSLKLMGIQEHEAIGDKSISGTPTRYLYERGITDGKLFLDIGISDTTEVYEITFLRQVEDFDAASDTPDFPQEWERPLVAALTIRIATSRGLPVTQDMKDELEMALSIAKNVDAENAELVQFESER